MQDQQIWLRTILHQAIAKVSLHQILDLAIHRSHNRAKFSFFDQVLLSQMQTYLEDAPVVHGSPKTSKNIRKRSFDVADGNANDTNNHSTASPSNHLVLYDPGTSGTSQDAHAVSDLMDNHTSTSRNFLAPISSGRTFPSIGTFTVQCDLCFKWRIIPTKEKYEQIREHILEEPFICEHAREWRPDISCEDPEDISQDGSRLWAIDKPNIAKPPPGWERLLRIRGEGGTKFADVYYAAPSGKRLRSMVEIQRYLLEHPEHGQGVTLSQFSFQSPRPLQENYVRKRPARLTNSCNDPDTVLPRPTEPEEVNPLSWAAPPTHKELLTGGPASSSPRQNEDPTPTAATPSSEQMCGSSLNDQPKMKLEDGDHSRNPFEV
ncbi:unnamed protein product [Musa hybrid cultivar]